jgi:hypothetical protein
MHKFWTGLARFFAVIVSIVSILTASGSTILVTLDRRLFENAAVYKNALNQQQIYARLPHVLAGQILLSLNYKPCPTDPTTCQGAQPGGTSVGGPQAILKGLAAPDWEAIITTFLPPALLRGTTENLLDQVFATLNGRQAAVVLKLGPLKDRISGQAGLDNFLALIRTQPPCTAQQIEQVLASFGSGQGTVVLCCRPKKT